MRTSGQTILITGGSAGIGLALSKRFITSGNRVIVVGRDPHKLVRLKQDFPQIETITCELGNRVQRQQLVQTLKNQYSDLSVVINNAGVQYNYSFLEEQDPKIIEEIEINLTAPIELCYKLLPMLKAKEEAAIVNISSGLALVPKTSAAVYCGTKAGLHLFSKVFRNQLEGTSVRVFEVLPAVVDTEMTRGRGTNKMSPDQLVDEFMPAFAKNQYEISIGKVKLLKWMLRIAPGFADRLFKRS
ncbi:SDR family oxidoreductase [Paenibacillus eucommiae]|uniref:Short-subunit dehydrogenase involved in D-alanine esterification of teichoic acids n=1 Tax=Paenibacillus eucommiae TaxID=1355755 RepID=A0ABS4J089_9BACL|nr:SDR family NAD(P)-dependent oxidoreductase [Paenibacillus eucommiae]MBP1993223.1 short-subunit dehydrogenase involved in D-alanine esterification of teichoic acids [Paenibacillus eucommiae]